MKMDNPGNLEILPALGTIQGLSRKIIVIGCYILPNYTSLRAAACLDYIEELVIESKQQLKDPIIVVIGDFNQWPIQDALREFRDIAESAAGPTRGTRTIDRTFTNFNSVTGVGTLNPLQTDDEDFRESDHRIFYLLASIRRQEKYKWLK